MSENQWQEESSSSLETSATSLDRSVECSEIIPAREGLPRNFRMRADRHYVDLLAEKSGDQPVRMVAVGQIDDASAEAESDLRPLIESIRQHGIVHPLLLAGRNGRYTVIAGHKRLRAAQALRLAAVPSLLRDVGESEAFALAAADNLSLGPSRAAGEGSDQAVAVQTLIADHLSAIRRCTEMGALDAEGLNRSTLDMLKAHAWRATTLTRVLQLLNGVATTGREERSLASFIGDVVDGFAPEARLVGVALREEIRADLASSGLNRQQLVAGVSGAMLAMLPLVPQPIGHPVVIRMTTPSAGVVAVEIVLQGVTVPRRLAASFFDPDYIAERPGGRAAAIGALAAHALAERNGGEATFHAVDQECRLTIGIVRRC